MHPKLIDISSFSDARGSLYFLDNSNGLPFAVKRIYYMKNVPKNSHRGDHGHYKLQQVFIALNGSVRVDLEGAYPKQSFTLDAPNTGLYVPEKSWRRVVDFSENAILMVLASEEFSGDDYSHDKVEFLRSIRQC